MYKLFKKITTRLEKKLDENQPREQDPQTLGYVEICKTIKREDIRTHNLDEIRETIEATKSLKKVRRIHSLGKNRMITLLDKQGKEIQEQI